MQGWCDSELPTPSAIWRCKLIAGHEVKHRDFNEITDKGPLYLVEWTDADVKEANATDKRNN